MSKVDGNGVIKYNNVVVRNSTVGCNSILADNVFITDSSLGKFCTIERRGMIFNSIINDYSYTGYNSVVKYADIGKFCSISWNVSIGGADHDYHKISTHPFSFTPKYGFTDTGGGYSSFENPLIIGNDVWIGCNSVILRGVKIGDGAVIGASAVVTKDVPAYSIVAGNPGKVIKYRFDDSIINKLLNMNWWEWSSPFLRENLQFFKEENITINLLNKLEEKYNLFIQKERIINE